MAVYAIYIEETDDGGLEIHSALKRGIYRKGGQGEQATLVARNAIKSWIEENGREWRNEAGTTILEAYERLAGV